MIVGNKREIKNQFFDEVSADIGGGAGLEISWNPTAMEAAAGAYRTANKSYQDALAEITGALGALDGAWTGSAATEWTTQTNTLLGKLSKIGDTLKANAANLKLIAGKLSDVETEMTNKVGQIVGE